MRQIRKRTFFLGALIAFAAVGAVAWVSVYIYHHFYGMLRMNVGEYAPVVEAGEYNLVYQGEYHGIAIKVDDQIYLDMDVLNEEWANNMLFYAEDVEKVYYTTPTEMVEIDINREGFKLWKGKVYMLGSMAKEMFGTQYKVNETDSMVALQSPGGTAGEVLTHAYLLSTPGQKERNYTAELKRGETIALYDCSEEGFYYAMTEDGYTGYVEAELLNVSESQLSQKTPPLYEMDDKYLPDEPVSLAWQQVYSSEFSAEVYNEIAAAGYYINVVSPTWFKLSEDGEIMSLANANYVDWSHNQGLQVWALFDNSFDDALTREALSSTENRHRLVQQLLQYCEEYELDGINVDFEQMSEETNRCFIQFLRELSVTLRQKGYLLTIDVPVPSEWTDYYQRDVMYDLCDYVIVMAYDEHYAGDTMAGSTSSQKFTAEAIYNMLQEGVGKDKLILGVPFYTRIWMGVDNLRSEAVGMDQAYTCVYDNDLTLTYDKETGQNYAEGMVGETLYRIWLEDTTSMKWRIKLMQDNDLAGVAAWSLGFESSDIWTVYEEAFY